MAELKKAHGADSEIPHAGQGLLFAHLAPVLIQGDIPSPAQSKSILCLAVASGEFKDTLPCGFGTHIRQATSWRHFLALMRRVHHVWPRPPDRWEHQFHTGEHTLSFPAATSGDRARKSAISHQCLEGIPRGTQDYSVAISCPRPEQGADHS